MDNTKRNSDPRDDNFRAHLMRLRAQLDELKLGLEVTRGEAPPEAVGDRLAALQSNILRLEEYILFLDGLSRESRNLSFAVARFGDTVAAGKPDHSVQFRENALECAEEAWEIATECSLLSLQAETSANELRLVSASEKERFKHLK